MRDGSLRTRSSTVDVHFDSRCEHRFISGHVSRLAQGRRPYPALVQSRHDEPALCSDLRRRCSRSSCGALARPGGLASLKQAPGAQQHHHCSVPPKCPELNAQENFWQYMRDNCLFQSLDTTDALLDHCCDAWNKLEAQLWTIMFIGPRDSAHGF